MYVFVNASPPKPLDVATQNFADSYATRCGYWATFSVTLTSQGQMSNYVFFVNASPPKLLDII